MRKFLFTILVLVFFSNSLYGTNFCNVEITDTLDFELLRIRNIKEKNIVIYNGSNYELTINAIKVNTYLSDYIDISGIQLPIYLAGNSGVNIPVKFHAKQNVNFDGIIFFNVTCSASEYSLPVYVKSKITLSEKNQQHFTDNLWGSDLIDVMMVTMSNHKVFSYRDARILFWSNFDRGDDGQVECIYTGNKINPGDEPDFSALDNQGFNTEHTWPRSMGADSEPPLSDINHLFVADKTTNDRRGNHPFGNISGNPSYEKGGSKLGKDASGKTVFEVRPETRGNIARAMFYFAVRYDNPNKFLDQQEETLRQWALQDPVDAAELARNDSVAVYQERANIFIGYPEMLERMPSISKRTEIPFEPLYFVSDTGIVFDFNITKIDDFIRLYVTNFSNDSRLAQPIEIESIELQNDDFNFFDIKYDETNFSLSRNEVFPIDVISINQNGVHSANLKINFKSGHTETVNLYGKNPMMSVEDNINHLIDVSIYPNPASDYVSISIVEKNAAENINSIKVYDVLSGEIADLTNSMIYIGNQASVEFSVKEKLISSQVLYVKIELKSGKYLIHPMLFMN
ncbi:MAG: endonuclease [Candidatus Kapabacteria bacterium]|nr:endonuclease [Ignavibacteriota bacterium]MCW5884341.1 endonuclease [Candidatus Kapabacteria bacterium]